MLAAAATTLLVVCATLLAATPYLLAERAQRRSTRRLDRANCRGRGNAALTAASTRRRRGGFC